MTKDEFEQAYAERSGMTVEELHEMGRAGRPCDCGDEICEGWQMVNEREWEEDRAAGRLRGVSGNSWLYR